MSFLGDYIPGEEAVPEDVFEPVFVPNNMQAFLAAVTFALRKAGHEVSLSEEDLASVKGWNLNLLYNARTKVLKLACNHPEDIWSKTTPGVEAGHA